MFIGRKYQVGIGKEATRGTAVVPTFWLPKLEVSVENKEQYLDSEASMGNIHDSDLARIVKEWSEGEITGHVRDKSFGLFLLSAFGAVSSAVKETTAYNHTFTVANANNHQSLTVEVKNDLEQLKYARAVLNSLKISAQVGKFVEFAVGMKAIKGVTAANTPAYVTENEFISKNITFKTATNIAGLAAASAISVKSIELSIDKNVDDLEVLGSVAPADYANKEFKVEGVIEASFENLADFKAVFEAGTLKAMRIDITNSDVTIGATSNPELKIDLASVSFQDWSRKSGNGEIVSQTIKFKAHYSLADTKMIEAVLTNLQTAY